MMANLQQEYGIPTFRMKSLSEDQEQALETALAAFISTHDDTSENKKVLGTLVSSQLDKVIGQLASEDFDLSTIITPDVFLAAKNTAQERAQARDAGKQPGSVSAQRPAKSIVLLKAEKQRLIEKIEQISLSEDPEIRVKYQANKVNIDKILGELANIDAIMDQSEKRDKASDYGLKVLTLDTLVSGLAAVTPDQGPMRSRSQGPAALFGQPAKTVVAQSMRSSPALRKLQKEKNRLFSLGLSINKILEKVDPDSFNSFIEPLSTKQGEFVGITNEGDYQKKIDEFNGFIEKMKGKVPDDEASQQKLSDLEGTDKPKVFNPKEKKVAFGQRIVSFDGLVGYLKSKVNGTDFTFPDGNLENIQATLQEKSGIDDISKRHFDLDQVGRLEEMLLSKFKMIKMVPQVFKTAVNSAVSGKPILETENQEWIGRGSKVVASQSAQPTSTGSAAAGPGGFLAAIQARGEESGPVATAAASTGSVATAPKMNLMAEIQAGRNKKGSAGPVATAAASTGPVASAASTGSVATAPKMNLMAEIRAGNPAAAAEASTGPVSTAPKMNLMAEIRAGNPAAAAEASTGPKTQTEQSQGSPENAVQTVLKGLEKMASTVKLNKKGLFGGMSQERKALIKAKNALKSDKPETLTAFNYAKQAYIAYGDKREDKRPNKFRAQLVRELKSLGNSSRPG